MRGMIASLNAAACAPARRQSPERTTELKLWDIQDFIDQKKIAGRNVNGKENSILNTTEFCLDNGEYLSTRPERKGALSRSIGILVL